MKQFLKATIYSIVILFTLYSPRVHADSALFIAKPPSVVAPGDTIELDIKVRATDQSINAVSGSLSFPDDLLRVVSVTRNDSILNIWTHGITIEKNTILFEGVILNPGYKGSSGMLFHVIFEAKKIGTATVSFTEGSLLANDGMGTNVVTSLGSVKFSIANGGPSLPDKGIVSVPNKGTIELPIITDYPLMITSKDAGVLKGKGEPGGQTLIVFENLSYKSFGERFMDFIRAKRNRLHNVLIRNDENGEFQYVTPQRIVSGAYSATPFLVDNTSKIDRPGQSIQFFVMDSRLVKLLVLLMNVLILLIPIVLLLLLIYFIPWYSLRRMSLIKKRMHLEEEEIKIEEKQLENEEKILGIAPDQKETSDTDAQK